MDDAILQNLDLATVSEALALWTFVQKSQQDLEHLNRSVAQAQQTVTAFNSSESSISQPARTDLRALLSMGQKFVAVSNQLASILNLDTTPISLAVGTLNDALNSVSQLDTSTVTAFNNVLSAYSRLQTLRDTGGEITLAQSVFSDYANHWLNQDTTFDLGDDKQVKVRFSSDLSGRSPFRGDVNLSAELVYGAMNATVEGISLKIDAASGKVVPEFSTAHIKPGFDPSSFASAIASQLAADLPAGLTIKNADLDTSYTPPSVTLDAAFAGLPGFDAMSFDASLRISPEKVEIYKASGGLPDLLVPIPPGELAIKGFTFGYDPKTELHRELYPLKGPALRVGTSIVPMWDGGTGETIALVLDAAAVVGGIYFPLANLGKEFGFKGTLRLLGTLSCGDVNGHFALVPPGFNLSVQIPSSANSSPSPFGTEKIFSMDADCVVNKDGIRFGGAEGNKPATMTLLELIHGEASGNMGFNGEGHLMATGDVQAFGATASFSANWTPGFKDLVVDVSASVSLRVPGLEAFNASAHINCTVADGVGKRIVTADILGVKKVEEQEMDSDNLAEFLLGFAPKPNDIAQLLFDKGSDLLKELDPTNTDSFLRRQFASVPGFKLVKFIPIENIYNGAESGIKTAVDIANAAAKNPLGTITSWAGAAANSVGHIRLAEESDNSALSESTGPFGTTSSLPPDFLSNIDQTVGKIPLANIAISLCQRLKTEVIQSSLQRSGEGKDASYQVDSRLDARFDQIFQGAKGVDVAKQTADSSYTSFFVTGSTSCRRGGKQIRASFADWGYVSFVNDPSGQTLARIVVTVQNSPLNDASLLQAKSQIYGRIKKLILDIDPSIRFGDLANPSGDPGDPGNLPAPDLNFDHPPAGQLPVLGKLGIARVTLGPTGALIIELTSNGAADKAGLKFGDVVTKINGLPVTSFDTIPTAVRSSLQRLVVLDVISSGSARTVNVNLDPVSLLPQHVQ